jgi:hypothetical protein
MNWSTLLKSLLTTTSIFVVAGLLIFFINLVVTVSYGPYLFFAFMFIATAIGFYYIFNMIK